MRAFCAALAASALLFARDPFTLAGQTVPEGTARSFTAAVAGTQVPITVIHGAKAGPVLTLTAGIHGDEFPPILALQRLRTEVRPAELSGTLVLVHLANVTGFLARRIAVSPVDGKNLNRVFPGRADGTLTEQVAHFLTTEVIAKTEYLIDMHAGSANQELWPHVYSPFVGQKELDDRTHAFALATGMRHVVLYGDRPRDPARSISYPNTAMTRGKPGLTIEIGQLGQRDEAFIQQVLAVSRNALRFLKMLPGEPEGTGGAVVYRKLHEVASPVTGVFHPRCRIGETVDSGALLGEVTDWFGNRVAELRAPLRGTVLMLHSYPAVNQGDTPVTLGEAR